MFSFFNILDSVSPFCINTVLVVLSETSSSTTNFWFNKENDMLFIYKFIASNNNASRTREIKKENFLSE
jgi:hypothetical protein